MSARDDAVTGAVWAALHENSTVFDAPLFNAALRAAGYAVVPVEATDEMCIAATARNDLGENRETDPYGLYRTIYRAMIAAAGEPT